VSTIAGEGPLALLVFGRHPDDTDCFEVAPGVTVQPLAKRQGIDPVGLHSLAALVPILRLHDVVGHAHFRELAMEVETEGSGLTGAPAPALRAAFEAVYLAPLDS